jgi:hypothetical protein
LKRVLLGNFPNTPFQTLFNCDNGLCTPSS